jgi:hypothetical protein
MPEVELPNLHEIEEQKEKKFSKRVALVTACYAVLLAITALGGGKAMKEMLLCQQQASDQWSFYQAKSIREQIYRSQSLMAEATLAEKKTCMSKGVCANYEKISKEFKDEAARYNGEKKEIEEKARDLEKERDKYHAKDPYFEFGEALLQIAIVLASISILASSAAIFGISLVSAGLGTFLMLNGYFMFMNLPFFH